MRRSISVWDHEIPRLLEFGKDQPHQHQIECQDSKHDVAPSDFKSLIRWTQLVGIGPSGFSGQLTRRADYYFRQVSEELLHGVASIFEKMAIHFVLACDHCLIGRASD